MQTKTELTWHHVTHDGGIATGLPDFEEDRDLLVLSHYFGKELTVLRWSYGHDALERGFHEYAGNGYYEMRNDSNIVAWAELPTADEVMTDDEKELYS